MARRTYTDEDKAYALAAYDIHNKNLERAAKFCKVPRNTLRRWISGEDANDDAEDTVATASTVATVATLQSSPNEIGTPFQNAVEPSDASPLRQQKKEMRAAMADRMEEMIHKLIDCIPMAAMDASLKEIATAIGILTDKRQLLLGKDSGSDDKRPKILGYTVLMSQAPPAEDTPASPQPSEG